MTMRANRNKIKNDVLQKTEIEISRIQEDYEKLIKNLEEVLEKKLVELKKEEEEHKILHDKYEAMYTRAKVENWWSALHLIYYSYIKSAMNKKNVFLECWCKNG